MSNTPEKPRRNRLWSDIEADIQRRAANKDGEFVLTGTWKEYVREQDGLKIYAVDGTWIRNNLSVIFGHGGHGFVHEFIPKSEIWIATHHPGDNPGDVCGCRNVSEGRIVSPNFFDSTTIHEITEFLEMAKGKSFLAAHKIAIKREIEAGLLPDPYTEI